MLTLRVLVDGCAVEAFAQGGRATTAGIRCSANGGDTALVWRAGADGVWRGDGADGADADDSQTPVFSVRIWEMNSAWVA